MKPQALASLSSTTDNENVSNKIIQYHGDYPGIIKVRENPSFTQLSKDFKFKQVP